MPTNFHQDGKTINHAHGNAVTSGEAVPIGGLLGIASVTADSATTIAYQVEGVYALPKVDAAAIAAGQSVMWDASAGEVDDNQATPAAGDLADFGIAWETKGPGVNETILVKINTGNGVVT